MSGKVLTAPKAIITINGTVAGFARDISWSENYQRVDVRGLGEMWAQETDVVGASGTWSAGKFFISFNESDLKALINRNLNNPDELSETLNLGEKAIQIVIYKKTIQTQNASTGIVEAIDKQGETIVTLDKCFIDGQNWSLAEGGVASVNTTGRYILPALT